MSLLPWLSVAILVATLMLMLIRPLGIAEAWFAAGGALAILLIGIVRLADVGAVIVETSDVLLFLFGMVILTELADGAGVFRRLAEVAAKLAFGSGLLLFLNVFILGALVTAFLSLDVTILVLTPIVFEMAVRRRVDAVPFLFACTFVANTASLVLPISNLTNLLLFSQLHLPFLDFVAVMWLPNLVAAAVNFAVFVWLFRHRLPRRLTGAAASMPPVVARYCLVPSRGDAIRVALARPCRAAPLLGGAAGCGLPTRDWAVERARSRRPGGPPGSLVIVRFHHRDVRRRARI